MQSLQRSVTRVLPLLLMKLGFWGDGKFPAFELDFLSLWCRGISLPEFSLTQVAIMLPF